MRKLRRLGVMVGAIALSAGSLPIAPAMAAATGECAPQGSIWGTETSANARLGCDGSAEKQDPLKPAASRSGRVSKPACVWVPEPGYQPGVGEKTDGAGGHWYRKFCSFGDYQTLADFEREMGTWDAMNMQRSNMLNRAGLEIRWFTTPPPAPRPTPEQVMASIVDNLPIPKPFIAVNPVATKQVVGFPTWVWLTDANGQFVADRYQQKSNVIVLPPDQLRWQIVPQIALTPGDGGPEQACAGAGVPWSATADGDPGACTMTYDKSGQYTLSASVAWTVQWWLNGARQPDVAGPTSTATKPLTVLEIQALTR
jgi:hypothetical protein